MCVDECPSPFVGSTGSLCVCPEGKTGDNCELGKPLTLSLSIHYLTQSLPDVVCSDLEAPANAMIAYSDSTMIGSVATYSCSDGYSLTGEPTRTCLATGSWSGSEPTCTGIICIAIIERVQRACRFECSCVFVFFVSVVDCGALENPVNGLVAYSDTTFSSTGTYTCSSGYTLDGDAMRNCLASGTWSGSQPMCAGPTLGAGCSEISTSDVERVLSSYVAEQICSDPTSCDPVITVTDMYINCLSSGSIRGTYSHTTVTVSYRITGTSAAFLAQTDIGCSNATNTWEASVLRSLASSLDQVFASGSGTEDADTRTSCSACLSPQLAVQLGTTSDSTYHCVG